MVWAPPELTAWELARRTAPNRSVCCRSSGCTRPRTTSDDWYGCNDRRRHRPTGGSNGWNDCDAGQA